MLELRRRLSFRWFQPSGFRGFGRFVSVVSLVSAVSFRSFRWFRPFRFGGFAGFGRFVSVVLLVSVVSAISFRWFRFVVSGFSTCRKNEHSVKFESRQPSIGQRASRTSTATSKAVLPTMQRRYHTQKPNTIGKFYKDIRDIFLERRKKCYVPCFSTYLMPTRYVIE